MNGAPVPKEKPGCESLILDKKRQSFQSYLSKQGIESIQVKASLKAIDSLMEQLVCKFGKSGRRLINGCTWTRTRDLSLIRAAL